MSMKKKYKVILIVLAAILVVVGSVLMLKREKKREIVLTDFKYGSEYQFGALDWHTTLEEVEDYLKCSLEPVPGMTPPAQSGYAFYCLSDATYFFNGNSATDRIEFKDNKLSMIQFTLRPENSEALLKEIVAELQENFGPESNYRESEDKRTIGYQWRTDTSMLQITYSNSTIMIFVGTLDVENEETEAGGNKETTEKSDKTEKNESTEGMIELKFADFKQGDEYQYSLIPLSTSLYELRSTASVEYKLSPTPEWNSFEGQEFCISGVEYLLEGKVVTPIYEFLYGELVAVQLAFRSEKEAEELFEPFAAELTKLFGQETERSENKETGSITCAWQTDQTRLRINYDILNGTTDEMILFIDVGYTETERDRILAENIKVPRELMVNAFKQGQEYQFGEAAWNSSVKEVEVLLDCKLKDVTTFAPEKDYVFYDFANVVYVLDGYEAEASVEFRADELVFVGFDFNELEDPKAFFEEIVSVCQAQYGPETESNESNDNGNISYRWKTENTLLAVGLYEEYGDKVEIFLTPLK